MKPSLLLTFPRSSAVRAASLGLLFAAAAPSARAQALTVQDGLQLWLKADAGVTADGDGAVSEWKDQTLNSNSAVQLDTALEPAYVANALNGKPVIRFDGVDDYMEVPDSDSISIIGDMTTFFVVRFQDFATFRAVWGKTSVNFPGPFDYYTLPDSGVPRAYRGNGTNTNLGSFDGGTALRADTYLTVGYGLEGETLSHYLGSQPTSSGTIGGISGDGDTALIIGSRGDLFTKMKGDIAEVLIYDRALTEAERVLVTGYLGTKYNIANLPPTVALTALPAGASVPAGTTVTLTATAADADGTVERVDFLANGQVAGSAIAPPYSLRVTLDTPGTHVFTARAVDNKGATAVSAAVSREATGGGAVPALEVRENLSLWLKADAGVTSGEGGVVTAWEDQSGNDNDAVANDEFSAPVLAADAVAGRPAIRFDGADDVLTVADSESVSFTGDLTSFFIVKVDNFDTYRAVWAKTLNNQPASVDFYMLPGSGLPQYFRGNGAGNANFGGPSAYRAGVFELGGFSSAGNVMSQYLNGRLNGSVTAAPTLADADTPLLIGTRADGVTRLAGDLAEVVIYNTALTTAQRRSVELYFASKYSVPFSTPQNDAPTVTLTSPAAGQSMAAPATLTASAAAADADGAVVRVEFLVNGTVAAVDTTAPYEASIPYGVGGAPAVSARAVDNFGVASAETAPVTVTVTGGPVSPLPSPGSLSLWLRADQGITQTGGVVSAWEDFSGNLNHGVQTTDGKRPVVIANELSGKPVLRFDGVDDELRIPGSRTLANSGDITSFFVVRFDDFATFRGVWGKTAGGLPRSTDYYMSPNEGKSQLFRGGVSGFQAVSSTLAMTAGQFYIAGFDVSETLAHHFLDGGLSGLGPITIPTGDTGNPLVVGSREDGVTRMKGDIAELIIYNSALSDADRTTVMNYLSARYGIPVSQVTTETPTLSAAVSGGTLTLSWPAGVNGWVLESSPTMEEGSWTAIPSTAGNTWQEPVTGTLFYRLRLTVPQ